MRKTDDKKTRVDDVAWVAVRPDGAACYGSTLSRLRRDARDFGSSLIMNNMFEAEDDDGLMSMYDPPDVTKAWRWGRRRGWRLAQVRIEEVADGTG